MLIFYEIQDISFNQKFYLNSRYVLCPRTITKNTDSLIRAMLTHVDTILRLQFHLWTCNLYSGHGLQIPYNL